MKNAIYTGSIFMCALLFILNPQASVTGIGQAVFLCLTAIIPSLFPYTVLTGLWVSSGADRSLSQKIGSIMKHMFHLPPSAVSAFLLGNISGFPLGAQTVMQLYEKEAISKSEAEYLLFFCSNAGPAFIIGVVGRQLFQSTIVGIILWCIHMGTSVLLGMLFRPKIANNDYSSATSKVSDNFFQTFTASIINAGESLLRTCFFIAFFCVITSHLSNLFQILNIHNPLTIIFLGGLELSSGVTLLDALPAATAFVAAAALLGWNGICIHCQVLSCCANKNISLRLYFLGKLLHIALSTAVSCIVVRFLPYVLTCSTGTHLQPVTPYFVLQLPALLFIAKIASGKAKAFHI